MKTRYALFDVHRGTVLLAALVYAGVSGLIPVLKFLRLVSSQDRLEVYPVMILMGIAVLYGIVRITAFHPFCRPDYLAWLETTPWRFPLPLPLGPIQLVAVDVLLLCVIAAIAAFHLHLSPRIFLIGFGWSYLACLAHSLHRSGQHAAAYVLGVGLAACFLLENSVWIACLLVALYPLAYLALQSSLRNFPWPKTEPADSPNHTAWHPSPSPLQAPVNVRQVILACLLWGWWLYCGIRFCWYLYFLTLNIPNLLKSRVEYALTQSVLHKHYLWLGAFGVCCAGYRLFRYCANRWPPISVFGRIATGRLIIPNYDRVLIAPLCSLLICFFLPRILFDAGFPLEIVASATVTLALLSIRSIGPTLQDWELTGGYRLVVFHSQTTRERSAA